MNNGAYMELARSYAALFSQDPDTRVGCLLVAPGSSQVLSMGANGMCRGASDAPDRWRRPAKYAWVVHAEINAVANAARTGVRLDGSTCVTTLFPCADCCKALIQAGVRTLVAPAPDLAHPRWGEDFRMAVELLDECGVRVCRHR